MIPCVNELKSHKIKVSEKVFIMDYCSAHRKGATRRKILKCSHKGMDTSSGNNHYQSLHIYIFDIKT